MGISRDPKMQLKRRPHPSRSPPVPHPANARYGSEAVIRGSADMPIVGSGSYILHPNNSDFRLTASPAALVTPVASRQDRFSHKGSTHLSQGRSTRNEPAEPAAVLLWQGPVERRQAGSTKAVHTSAAGSTQAHSRSKGHSHRGRSNKADSELTRSTGLLLEFQTAIPTRNCQPSQDQVQ